MKKLCCLILLLFMLTEGKTNAQGFFNQKGAWIKNQVKQIALWELYIKDIEKGYDIAKEGLNTINDIKQGDFHLHLDHFSALTDVNPPIKNYSKAVEILQLQSDIKKLVTRSENDYINFVFAHLIAACNADVEELNRLLSPGNYQMTDNERLSNIDRLYAGMKDKYAFAKSFARDIKILSIQQLKEKNETETIRLLHNTKP